MCIVPIDHHGPGTLLIAAMAWCLPVRQDTFDVALRGSVGKHPRPGFVTAHGRARGDSCGDLSVWLTCSPGAATPPLPRMTWESSNVSRAPAGQQAQHVATRRSLILPDMRSETSQESRCTMENGNEFSSRPEQRDQQLHNLQMRGVRVCTVEWSAFFCRNKI